LIETPWRADALAAELRDLAAALPGDAWPCLALGNHDRPRLATRLGRRQARVAAVLLLTLRGTVSLFYGDELGMRDQPVPRERQRDYFGLFRGGVSRDPSRTPMPWTDGPNGGFSSADPDRLWLPASDELATLNAATQLADPDSMLSLYARLGALRRDSTALRVGAIQIQDPAPDGVLVYTRVADGDRKLVALNLTGTERAVSVPAGTIALSTDRARTGESVTGVLTLGSDEAVVVDLPATVAAPDRRSR
jgi:alpha-glucosidase